MESIYRIYFKYRNLLINIFIVFSLMGALIATGEKSRIFFLGMGTASGLIILGEGLSKKNKRERRNSKIEN
jgi:hypothetical protein